MRSKSHGSKKITTRKSGRHHAPSRGNAAGKVAAKAVPALAALGVLAAGPQLYKLATSAPANTAAHLATADMTFPAQADSARQQPLAVVRHDVANPRSQHREPAHPRPHATSASSRSPAPAPSPAASASGALACSGSATGMVPENYATIVSFLTAHGYTGLAAAGIAGNIYQESGGNPESVGTGGGGLIGWTPLPAGFVTGNAAADLQTQLQALLTFNNQWSQYIPALNAATSATQAADIYMNDFERPGIPAAYNRETAAQAVAAACGL